MTETTFHKEKVYIPRTTREKLGLVDGDRLEAEVVSRNELRLRVIRRGDPDLRILARIRNPPSRVV